MTQPLPVRLFPSGKLTAIAEPGKTEREGMNGPSSVAQNSFSCNADFNGRSAIRPTRRIIRKVCRISSAIQEIEICAATRRSELLHRIIHHCEELAHRAFGFVPHVRDTEGCAFNLAVPAID